MCKENSLTTAPFVQHSVQITFLVADFGLTVEVVTVVLLLVIQYFVPCILLALGSLSFIDKIVPSWLTHPIVSHPTRNSFQSRPSQEAPRVRRLTGTL